LLAGIASDLNVRVSRKKLSRLTPEERLDYLVQQAVTREGDAEVVRNTVNRYFFTCQAHERALAAYRPPVYAGPVTLFRCRSKSGNEYTHGWGNLAAGGVQIHAVPGSHQTMITEPRVRVLARKLQASIDTALAKS
jgi:thioesterase domain-containing protein